ncbi:hypothetical protein RR46_10367 [Papilio xuthus]|uniref:Uncharacterized protein n=1 Tax=Papilio xuthus TaxID=66420 RepID=A0A194Q224_PAPXU|nr:hypothetical protein RR46_10367 [Papilio xuthus]
MAASRRSPICQLSFIIRAVIRRKIDNVKSPFGRRLDEDREDWRTHSILSESGACVELTTNAPGDAKEREI